MHKIVRLCHVLFMCVNIVGWNLDVSYPVRKHVELYSILFIYIFFYIGKSKEYYYEPLQKTKSINSKAPFIMKQIQQSENVSTAPKNEA